MIRAGNNHVSGPEPAGLEAMVKVIEASKGSWPFKKYALGIVVAFEYGQTLSTEWRQIKEALVNWQGSRARACKSLMLTFEAEPELWPNIRESVQRNGQEEGFIAPFFTQLDEVTLALITPDGEQEDQVQYTFRKAA
jgi:hypothetical protein